jgi:hypothetical protein
VRNGGRSQANRTATVRVPSPVLRKIGSLAYSDSERINPTATWGQERIANELLLKLGLRLSPRTARKYMPTPLEPGRSRPARSQRWQTFVRYHVRGLIASGAYEVFTQGVHTWYVWALRLLQRWRDRYLRRRSSPSARHEGFTVAHLDDTRSMRNAEPLSRMATAISNV